jgi:hypothetical protein
VSAEKLPSIFSSIAAFFLNIYAIMCRGTGLFVGARFPKRDPHLNVLAMVGRLFVLPQTNGPFIRKDSQSENGRQNW